MRLLAVCAVALAFGFIGSMPLAGPISVMVVSRAARRHFDEALRVGLGAAVAEAIYAGVAFWGFETLFASHPAVDPVSHGVTAVVLTILGIRFAVWKPKSKRDRHERRAGTWVLGFTISAINPTLLVTWSAAVAFLFSKGIAKGLSPPSWLTAILFGVSAGVGVGGWFAALVAVLRRLEGKLPQRVLTWTVRVLGVALVGLGVWSGVQLVLWLAGNRDSGPEAVALDCPTSQTCQHSVRTRADPAAPHRDAGREMMPRGGRCTVEQRPPHARAAGASPSSIEHFTEDQRPFRGE